MKPTAIFALFFALMLCALPVLAQKAWEKPLEEMNREDALRIIRESPYAKTYQSEAGGAAADAANAAREQNQSVYRGGSNPRSTARTVGTTPIVARLHSSMPVRRALVRLRQIDNKYDDMSGAERERFDEAQKGLLDCAICQDYYVVSLIKFKDTTPGAVDEGIFQRSSLIDLKGNIWLQTESGAKLELFQFTPPRGGGDAAYLFFKRTDTDGNPFITVRMKKFRLVFSNDFLDARNPYAAYLPRDFEFSVEKIVVGNKVDF